MKLLCYLWHTWKYEFHWRTCSRCSKRQEIDLGAGLFGAKYIWRDIPIEEEK